MWSDAQWKPSRGDGLSSFNRVAYCSGKSGWFYVRRDDDHFFGWEVGVILWCREKLRREVVSRPYPKPTQVVGQSMPRRTR